MVVKGNTEVMPKDVLRLVSKTSGPVTQGLRLRSTSKVVVEVIHPLCDQSLLLKTDPTSPTRTLHSRCRNTDTPKYKVIYHISSLPVKKTSLSNQPSK